MDKAIEALIVQLQRNQKETNSALEALLLQMRNNKDIGAGIDKLIKNIETGNDKITQSISKQEKKVEVDLEPLKQAFLIESNSIKDTIVDIKEKYYQKLKELQSNLTGNESKIARIEDKIESKFNELKDRKIDLSGVFSAIKKSEGNILLIEEKLNKPEYFTELINSIDDDSKKLSLDAISGLAERLEREVDSRYRTPTIGPRSITSITELEDVDVSGLTLTNGKYVLGSGSGGASSFLDLTDTPSSYDNAGGSVWKFIRVKTTNDGLEEVDISGAVSLVKISNNDTTPQHLSNKIVVSSGTNPGLSILETSILNGGGNEDFQIQIDETRINHDALLNFEEKEHIDWTVSQSPTYTIHEDNYNGFTESFVVGTPPNSTNYDFLSDGFQIQSGTNTSGYSLLKIKDSAGTTQYRITNTGANGSVDITHTGNLSMDGDIGITGGIVQTGDYGLTGNITQTGGNYGLTGDFTQTGNYGLTGNITQGGDFTQTGKITRTTAQVVPSSSAISIGGQRSVSFSGAGNVTGTTAVGNLFLTSWNDTDTLTSGGFGESMANFVMSATVENTGTVDKISNILASFENNNSATVTDYTAFNAFNANGDAGSLGGSLTNAYAFRLPSGTWSNISGIKRGVSIEDATVNNFFAGNIEIGGQVFQNSVTTHTPSGTTATIDFDDGQAHIIDLGSATGDVTLTLSNLREGGAYGIKVIQGATARNLIFPTGTIASPSQTAWDSGTRTLTMTATDDAVDSVGLTRIGGQTLLTAEFNLS